MSLPSAWTASVGRSKRVSDFCLFTFTLISAVVWFVWILFFVFFLAVFIPRFPFGMFSALCGRWVSMAQCVAAQCRFVCVKASSGKMAAGVSEPAPFTGVSSWRRVPGLTCSHPPCYHLYLWPNRPLGQPGICKGCKGERKGRVESRFVLGARVVALSVATVKKNKSAFSLSVSPDQSSCICPPPKHHISPPHAAGQPLLCSAQTQAGPKYRAVLS